MPTKFGLAINREGASADRASFTAPTRRQSRRVNWKRPLLAPSGHEQQCNRLTTWREFGGLPNISAVQVHSSGGPSCHFRNLPKSEVL
jgi:hypothetical protein